MFMPALILAAGLAPPGEADLLLRRLDAKIVAAKTLRIEYSFESRTSKFVEYRGTLLLAEGNRVRHKVTAKTAKGVLTGFPTRSDGRELLQEVASEAEGDVVQRLTMPDWHNAVVQSWLARSGAVLSSMGVPPPNLSTGKKPRPEEGPRTSNAKLLPDEEVNGSKTRVLEYDLEWPTNPDELRTAKVRLWLDPKTELPLRRSMAFQAKDGDTLTETYKRFEIDPELEDVLFELPTEADLLLTAMESKVRAAKTLRVEFEVKPPDAKQGSRVLLVLGDRNRFRIEIADDPGKTRIVVSDGKRIGEFDPGVEKTEFRPLPDWYTATLHTWLARGGTLLSIAEVEACAREDGPKPGPADGPRLTYLRLLPDETIDNVKCRVVGYDLTWRAGGLEFKDARARLWIDAKTKLPVRREITFQEKKLKGTWTATHTKFEIDPKLDDKLFDLPK